ncbi:MAG: response regulator transcription factor, partial [Actinomycetota bacterium]
MSESEATAVPGDRIRVLVVDDHQMFRRGVAMVLEQQPDLELVGEAGDVVEAVQIATDKLPDVVLMDVKMPRGSGIEATAQIKELVPSAKILMLTISEEEADLYDSLKAGATGYLLKDVAIEEVVEAIRSVHQGESRIS